MRRFIIITVSLYLAACVSLMYICSVRSLDKIKNTEANDVIFTIKNYWPDVDYAISVMQEYDIDYIVLGEDGKEIGASKEGLKTDYTVNRRSMSIRAKIYGSILGAVLVATFSTLPGS